jgi:hypothetical protein
VAKTYGPMLDLRSSKAIESFGVFTATGMDTTSIADDDANTPAVALRARDRFLLSEALECF